MDLRKSEIPTGTWISYTRDPSNFVARDVYLAAQEQAEGEGKSVEDVLREAREAKGQGGPKRKKTVCKLVGYDSEQKSLRVESIPITGVRASAVFPNQTHSWDIPEVWRGNPIFYVIRPEHDPKNKPKNKPNKKAKRS